MILAYHFVLHRSVSTALAGGQRERTEFVLEKADERMIPYNLPLMLLYLGIFLSAEGAFILMATKEYLQDIIGISDTELFAGELTSCQCVLHVKSMDNQSDAAKVLVDGMVVGYVPCRVDLAPGEYIVIAEKSGWLAFSEHITISPTERLYTVKVSLNRA